jgi:IS4 transposase|tara:strand:+ start:313 stop:1635 length:1323 start_codon:yes stop_codon:yes gene_type:complete
MVHSHDVILEKIREDPIAGCLVEMFPPDLILRLSRETGMLKRQRLLDPILFFWVLVFQFGANFTRKIRGLQRSYEVSARIEMSDSAFFERFTPELEELLHRSVLHAIEFQGQNVSRKLSDKLDRFNDILIQDSTIVRLHESLSKLWPAARARGKAAGLKLSTLVSVVADSPKRLEITPESTAETKTLKLGPWVKDTILLLDLGFFKLGFFDRIDAYKGFFVTRLKKGVNATIVGVNREWRGNAKKLIGENLWGIVKSLKREIIDVEAEFVFERRKYKGKTTKVTRRFRVVGVYNHDAKRYHIYLTNISPFVLSPEDIALLYGARWEIELIFKELKSTYRMDKITSKKPAVIRSLIWVAILTMMCSRRVLNELRTTDPKNAHRYTHQRGAMIFMERSFILLLCVLDIMGIEFTKEDQVKLYRLQVMDPNIGRDRLMDRWVT